MKRKLLSAIALCLWTAGLAAGAEVSVTEDAAAENTVYVAGNPDLYPFEYYDEEAAEYKGIVPQLLAEISADTGLRFTYIRSGADNEQKHIAANNQADMISAHIRGSVGEIAEEYVLFDFTDSGREYEVCIGFTSAADSRTASRIKRSLSSLSEQELLNTALAAASEGGKGAERGGMGYLWIVLACVLMLAAVLMLLMLRRQRLQQREREESRLTDKITGIGNERYFRQRYEEDISAENYSLYYIVYICIEIQRLEKYLGTLETDGIQRGAAEIIGGCAEGEEFSARIGDGVFVLALSCRSESAAETRTAELLSGLNDLRSRFSGDHNVLFRGGIFHMDSAAATFETALFNARQGYNRAARDKLLLSFADREAIVYEQLKTKLCRNLSTAVENAEFKLYLQFVTDARNGRPVGAEALSRWQSREDGLLTPGNYIEELQNAGIIDRLDFYMLEESCRRLELWKSTGRGSMSISCNFARLTISRADFADRLRKIAGRYDFNADRLIIELTEDSLSDNKALAYQNVLTCKELGFRIALDDLGCGYTSFSDLCDYPVDIIKVDRHIVAKSATPRGKALLRGIVDFAHGLGIKVLCEGVETAAENENVIDSGAEYIQGFYYSRVFPADEADKFYYKYSAEL